MIIVPFCTISCGSSLLHEPIGSIYDPVGKSLDRPRRVVEPECPESVGAYSA
jgi:hypothetical protein